MVTDFFFRVVWGLPLAGALFLLLLILGFFARTRPYAALFTFILNATELGGPKTGHSFFLAFHKALCARG